MLVSRFLLDMRPRWVDAKAEPVPGVSGSRYGVGIDFLCPKHSEADHRVTMLFSNPLDGLPPLPEARWYVVAGHGFADLTVVDPVDAGRPMVFGTCWRGWLAEGRLIDALSIG